MREGRSAVGKVKRRSGWALLRRWHLSRGLKGTRHSSGDIVRGGCIPGTGDSAWQVVWRDT